MKLYTLEYWPIHVICLGMLAAAVIDWWKFKVPNKLTFPLIFSGWALGLANSFGLNACEGDALTGIGLGGLWPSFVCTMVGLGLMLPIYMIGGMGAGDVKMTMGFGAWIGAFFGMAKGCEIVFWAFCVGTIVGGVIALGMIAVRGNYRQNLLNVKDIVGDVFQSSIVKGEAAERANKRRPRWHRLPYGVPLCIGFLGCLIFWFGV